ncbi:calsequestrin-1-like [Haliotis asinina]|uniref:calsequestrin-1-like n=1 Tax=Haliotis asinina TaxID=109174 RepID=UPI0035324794
MAASVELSVLLRDGSKKVFTKPAGQGDPPVDIKTLQNSLLSLQKETNSYLTDVVEKEKNSLNKAANGQSSVKSDDKDDDDDDDDDEEEEEENDEDNDGGEEPAEKKQKR